MHGLMPTLPRSPKGRIQRKALAYTSTRLLSTQQLWGYRRVGARRHAGSGVGFGEVVGSLQGMVYCPVENPPISSQGT